MFFTLALIALIICSAYFAISQVIIPIFTYRKLFPAFRSNKLKNKVNDTREQVADLTEQNRELAEINLLLKTKTHLEKQISDLEGSIEKVFSKSQTPKE